MREMRKKSRGINYNNEVAFERKPAQGFFDVEEERQMTREMGKEFRPVTLEEMEGRRRKAGLSPPIKVNTQDVLPLYATAAIHIPDSLPRMQDIVMHSQFRPLLTPTCKKGNQRPVHGI